MNKLVWNVLIYDFNNKKIVPYNIFYDGFLQEIIDDFYKGKSIKEAIKKWAKYHYWSRTEYEIQVGGLFDTPEHFKKIDIYDQIEMNLDNIAQYVEIKLFNLMEEE